MIFLISNFFEVLQTLSFNFVDFLFDSVFVFIHFFTPIVEGSILDYTLIIPIVKGSILDFTLACFVISFSLTFVFLASRRIGNIIRDASVTLGGGATAYQAYKMARNDDSDRIRREAEERAREAEAQKDQSAETQRAL
jgi:hypothetical protein